MAWLIVFVSEISKYLCAQYFFTIPFKRLRLIKRSLFLVLNKILSQNACCLIPRKQYRISLLVISQLIDSILEAVLGYFRISQGLRAPRWPYLCLLYASIPPSALEQSWGLSRTVHVHRYTSPWIFAGLWPDCILCCTISCNISPCHWLICQECLQLPEQTDRNTVLHEGHRALPALVIFSQTFPLAYLSSCSIPVLQCIWRYSSGGGIFTWDSLSSVCFLTEKTDGSPLLTFFCLPEHIRLSASSCTGHSLHSHSFKGWIEVGCFFFWPPLWPAVVWCKCMCRHRAGRSRVPLLCEGWSALWMWPWAGKRAIQSILWHPMHGIKRKICLEGKIIPPMWKKKAGF